VGAKVLLDVYEEGLVTKEEAKKIVTFTSNSGPMFIIGTVGVGMLLSKQAGYIMLLSHFLGSILNGVFYRFILPPSGFQKSILKPNPKNLNLVIENAMQHSITSLLFIGGYVAVFFALIELLTHYQVLSGVASFLQPLLQLLHIAPNVFEAILKGMFEITKGCFDVGQFMLPLKQSIVVCTGIISFGGLCVMLQAMRFLKLCHITSRFYLLQKGTHALFSMLIALGLARVFL
jgi:sporulation integral membrane protein YlbJ